MKSATSTDTAKVYRKAAERIADGRNHWSCCAIERAIHGEHANPSSTWSGPTKVYRNIFCTREDGDVYISDFDDAGGRPVRILALLLMAAMTERP